MSGIKKIIFKKEFNRDKYIDDTLRMDPEKLYTGGYQSPKLIIDRIIENVKDVNSMLELGCSAGIYAKFLENKLNRKIIKHGVDNNEISINAKILDKYFIEDVFEFQPKIKYDLVYSLGLYEHFNFTQRKLLFLKHVECSSRYVIIGFPNVFLSLRYLTIKVFDDFWAGNHHYFFNPDEIINMATQEGLRVVLYEYLGNFDILQKVFKFSKKLKNRFFNDYCLIILEKK
ncbi:MAG TPA: hypothetical protein PLL26_00705 [Candidatus Dojkabacteria bacterium]|nr:hypothetical protein [Candidatus Dojkabacteria bacterium]